MRSFTLAGGRTFLLLGAFSAFTYGATSAISPPLATSPATMDDTSWTKYIIAPSSRIAKPVKLVNTTGSVNNPDGVLSGDGVTTLLRPSSEDAVPSITLDFGLNIVGYPTIVFANASSNGPGVRVAFSETLAHLSNRSDFTRSDNADGRTQGTDNYRVPAERTVWNLKLECLYGNNQVCADGLHGFRYMRIALDALPSDAPYTAPSGSVSIEAVQLNITGILGTADTYGGWFESSDEALNTYWYQGSYTNEMTIDTFRFDDTEPRNAASPTLENKLVVMDGAKRDRDPYVGDVAVSGRTTFLTHPDANIAVRNTLADLAEHQQADGYIPPASIMNYSLPLFDYTLWWVSTSYDYVMYTGDTDYIKEYWNVAVKALDGWYVNKTIPSGLIARGDATGTGGFGDYAFLPRDGAVTYYNALYVRALKEAAVLADLVGGQEGLIADWKARAENVSQVLNVTNWDAANGAYLDSPTNSATRHAQDGNGMAVLAGVASREQGVSALNYMQNATKLEYGNAFMDDTSLVEDGNVRVYAFISYFDLEARFSLGMSESALDQIHRLYGWMAKTDPASTHWEGIGRDGTQYGQGQTSCAHGWSTGIVPLMINRVLGVIPTGPGFQTWVIKPNPADLTWAKGVVPTPKGPLSISWTKENSNFSITVNAPAGTSGTVMVPSDDSNSTDGYVVFSNVSEGAHTFSNN